jgi:hypothetical protein
MRQLRTHFDSTIYVPAPVRLSPGVPADLYLTNLTILNGSPTYRASNSVTGATNVVIGGTANVTLSAGSVVKLEPGFSTTAAGSGPTFNARFSEGEMTTSNSRLAPTHSGTLAGRTLASSTGLYHTLPVATDFSMRHRLV